MTRFYVAAATLLLTAICLPAQESKQTQYRYFVIPDALVLKGCDKQSHDKGGTNDTYAEGELKANCVFPVSFKKNGMDEKWNIICSRLTFVHRNGTQEHCEAIEKDMHLTIKGWTGPLGRHWATDIKILRK